MFVSSDELSAGLIRQEKICLYAVGICGKINSRLKKQERIRRNKE